MCRRIDKIKNGKGDNTIVNKWHVFKVNGEKWNDGDNPVKIFNKSQIIIDV